MSLIYSFSEESSIGYLSAGMVLEYLGKVSEIEGCTLHLIEDKYRPWHSIGTSGIIILTKCLVGYNLPIRTHYKKCQIFQDNFNTSFLC